MLKKLARPLHVLLGKIYDPNGAEMTFKVKNSLITMTLLLVGILSLIGVTYHSTRVIIDRTVMNHQQNIAAQAAATTSMWVQQQIKILSSAAKSLGSEPEDSMVQTMNILKMTMDAGDFSDVYIGLADGKMIDGAEWIPPQGYDPRIRPWYMRAKKTETIGFSYPYIDMTTKQMVIALSMPITSGRQIKGVLSADTNLDMLMKNVVNARAARGGYTFVVGQGGTIIMHPDKNLLMRQKVQDADPSLENILKVMKGKESGSFSYAQNGKEYILAYQKVENVDWYLCTTMTRANAYELSGRASMLLATESVLKVLGILVVVTMFGVGGSALVLYLYNRRFVNAMQKQQVQISGMNEDLKWNITRRKELETHYQTLFNVANDAIMVLKSMIFVDCNEKANELFGLSHYGILGNNMLDLSPAHQPDGVRSHEKALKIISEAEKGEQQFFNWNFLRSDGTEFPAEVSLKKLRLNNEQLILLSIRDISKRVNAEQQLRQAQKMAAMGEMVGAIAHQWRQPLNILSTYIASVQSAYYNNMVSREFVDKVVSGADSQIQFMSKTIDDFRHFFKPSKSKEPFDSIEGIESAARLISPNYKDCGIELTIIRPQEKYPLVVSGCRSEFVHVVLNLLANARDAIMEKNQESDEPKDVYIVIEHDDSNVIIKVKDTGCKIAAHIMPKIFNPYFSTKTYASGTGIGLYMSRMIIESEMQGTLTAQNYEHGAVFTITLPKIAKED